MARTSIIPATAEHAKQIAEFVRPADADELWAAAYMKPEEVMLMGMKTSVAETGCIDGVPVCMWGITPVSFIGRVGMPWMVGTYALEEHAIRFLRRNHRYIHRAMETFDKLFNYVDVRNEKAIEWLDWLGFKFSEPQLYGRLNLPFMKFTMENPDV